MGRQPSLKYQIAENLHSKQAFGESRHQDKVNNLTANKIYSYSTYHTYMKASNNFASFCKEKYNCKTLEQCEQHIKDYIEHRRFEDKVSAYTQKTELSALGKLYGKSYFKEVETDVRHRADITRSRFDTPNAKHFSEENNRELVNFCKNTGLRRSELETLKGNALIEKDNKYYLEIKGKGGRIRQAEILSQDKAVIEKMKSIEQDKLVWGRVHTHADIHSYRRNYAQSIYNSYARDLNTLSTKEKYYCRNDMVGNVYDRQALSFVSEQLGHSRVEVSLIYLR